MTDHLPKSIFVFGFVGKNGGNGGFEWRFDAENARTERDEFVRLHSESYDIADVREVELEYLGIEHTLAKAVAKDAITRALDSEPELWEPADATATS